MEIRVDKEPYSGRFSFLLIDKLNVGTKVVMEKCKEDVYVEPTFKMGNKEVQELFDSLWAFGLRPTNERKDTKDSLL